MGFLDDFWFFPEDKNDRWNIKIQYKNISVFYLLHDAIHVLFWNKMENKKQKDHIVWTLQNNISKA